MDDIYDRIDTCFFVFAQSLFEVVKGNSKTLAMMRIMGYDKYTCRKSVLGVYRPFACIGFIIGTMYQYGLLKLVMTFVFSNVENIPEYNFDWLNLLITLVAFVAVYEAMMLLFSFKIKKTSLKSVMSE